MANLPMGIGVTEDQLHPHTTLRMSQMLHPVQADPDSLFIVADTLPSGTAMVPQVLTLAANGSMPSLQNVVVELETSGVAGTRTVNGFITYINNLGVLINEAFTFTQTATLTGNFFTQYPVFRVLSAVVNLSTNVDAGDRISVGVKFTAASTKFALPQNVRTTSEIVAVRQTAFATFVAVNPTTGTLDLVTNSIRNITGVASGDILWLMARRATP